MDYPITLEHDDNRTVLVGFPDFPEAHTFGDDEAQALVRAQDALATILEVYIASRQPIPRPSVRRVHPRVPVPALVDAKVRLYEAMREAKIVGHRNRSTSQLFYPSLAAGGRLCGACAHHAHLRNATEAPNQAPPQRQ